MFNDKFLQFKRIISFLYFYDDVILTSISKETSMVTPSFYFILAFALTSKNVLQSFMKMTLQLKLV